MAKCQKCHTNPAEWAKQYIASDEPTYSTLGEHYRGFGMVKLCNTCQAADVAPPTEADPGDALDLLPACSHPPTALTCWHADSPSGPVLCVACNCGAVLAGGAE